MTHRKQRRTALSAAIAAAALVLAIVAPASPAALRHIDGTVLSKDAATHSFRIATQGGSKIRIKVNSKTRFERIGGFAGLKSGLAVEVEAARTDSGLLAKQVEPRTGGGGGGDDGPGDDHGGHGGDDGPDHT